MTQVAMSKALEGVGGWHTWALDLLIFEVLPKWNSPTRLWTSTSYPAEMPPIQVLKLRLP